MANFSAFGVEHSEEIAKFETVRPEGERKASRRSKGYWAGVGTAGVGGGIVGHNLGHSKAGVAAGSAIAGAGFATSAVSAHRASNKYRAKKGQAPRSFWTGQPKKSDDEAMDTKVKKSLELKPLVLNSNGELVGDAQGKGDQRDPKPGPFGVPKGPMVRTQERASGGGGEKTTMPKKSGVQGTGAGKRHKNLVSKAFEPMNETELDEILKGFGMGGVKSAMGAARGFTQFHGAGMANKAMGGYQAAKPKMKAGLKLAGANPGKTASVTAGVGAGAGFGIGRKSR